MADYKAIEDAVKKKKPIPKEAVETIKTIETIKNIRKGINAPDHIIEYVDITKYRENKDKK